MPTAASPEERRRSIRKYVVPVLAVLGVCALLFVAGAVYVFTQMVDTSTTSDNVASTLVRDPAYPYVGFWKTDCKHGWGIALERAGEGEYFARFCAGRGCDTHNYSTRTTLDGSPFRLLDADTIEHSTKDGMDVLHRCE